MGFLRNENASSDIIDCLLHRNFSEDWSTSPMDRGYTRLIGQREPEHIWVYVTVSFSLQTLILYKETDDEFFLRQDTYDIPTDALYNVDKFIDWLDERLAEYGIT